MNLQVKSGDLPPFKPLPQKPPLIDVTRKPDGTIYVRSLHPLGEMKRSVAHMLEEHAAAHPERNFIAERTPLPDGKTGDWRFITYGEMNARANAVAQALLDRGMGPDAPLMVISGNSIKHAVMMLGAMKARVPVAPVSVAYSLMSGDHAKLKHVFADDAAENDLRRAGADLRARHRGDRGRGRGDRHGDADARIATTSRPMTRSWRRTPTDAVAASVDKINHGTVAKYLFTSGSTGMPKGVLQTHGMMCAVVAASEALRDDEPDPDEIPQSLEWMPWNHISAGNIGFNSNLNAGGTVYLDAGKPLAGHVRGDDPQSARDRAAGVRLGAHRLRLAGRSDGEGRRAARQFLLEDALCRLWRRHAQPGHL